MNIIRRDLLTMGAAGAALITSGMKARAQARPVIRLGVLTDLSGPYKDATGQGSAALTRQAVEDFGDKGFAVEVIAADHQNKPDVGAAIARQWCDEGIDAIVDVPTSSVALAVNEIIREKGKVFLNSGAATTELHGKQCSPNTVQWTYDTYMLAKGTGTAVTKTGGSTWYFLTADYIFGQALQHDTTKFVEEAGGKVLGASPYPFGSTNDFSSFLLKAQASGAKVLGLANASGETVACIKQAREFGLQKTMKFAALLISSLDVKALGLEAGQGLLLSDAFYWDLNNRTRALTNRVKAKTGGNPPALVQAGCYGVTLHYLKAVADMGVARAKASGAAAVERMKAMPSDDDAFGKGYVRPDGRHIHDVYLFEVKRPSESAGPWDLYNLLATTPGDQAFKPMSEGGCPLVKS
jgi:branched-chain amino acid transport system substrate-binding protein